jgi:hypothetical protein
MRIERIPGSLKKEKNEEFSDFQPTDSEVDVAFSSTEDEL